MHKVKFLSVLLLSATLFTEVCAQEQLTREQILNMSIEQLSELPLEDLMQAVETLGVSSVDELFALIMNKNVSSASKKEESSFTSPLGTTVITHDELRTWGCLSIEDAFRLIPGMIVQQKTNGVYDVQLRGLSNIPDNNMLLYTENNNTILMVDGRSLHNYGIGTFNAEQLPISIEDVERIEVVRGACGALYGANAVNGVVNIITRKPDQSEQMISGSFQMGTQSTNIGDFAIRKALSDKVAAGVSFNIQYRERPTDKYRVLSKNTLYLDETESVDWTKAISEKDIQTYIENGTIVPVKCNDELSVEQFKYLREVSTNLPMVAVFARVQQLYAGAYEAAIKAGQSEQEAQVAAVTYAVQQMGGAITAAQVVYPPIYSLYYTTPIEYRDASKVHDEPRLARRTLGVNGYLTFTPATDVRINLTGGYSQNFVNTNTLVENPYSMNERIYKGGYFNADASIKDLHLLVNYAGECGNYSNGRPGFRIFTHKIFGTAEYDINLGDKDSWGALSIRPGINYQYIYAEDEKDYYDYGEGDVEMPGFFDGDAKLTSIAPALRLDYRKGNFRAICGVRSDKTNIPDKWNTSFQGVLSYKFNDKNFVRASYGRAMRSASLVNACANYRWLRSNGMGSPNEIDFAVNENANLMHADNIELGYRMQPSQKLLIDAEVFYSLSKDYTGMMARNMNVSFGRQAAFDAVKGKNSMLVLQTIETQGSVQAGNFPYEVTQIGAGVNVDWIISSKLIAKFNMNAQKTTIDNYYVYDQTEVFSKLVETSLTAALTTTATVLAGVNQASADDDAIRQAKALEMFQQFQQDGTIKVTDDRIIVGDKDIKDLDLSDESDRAIYEILNPTTVNGHKHKATPAVYGMLGLIAKPIDKLNIAAYANFIGKREYLTAYGSEELNPRCTVNLKIGYKPIDKFEVFFNGNNLFNNQKQEFVYGDKIGGVYTVGINFGF